MKEQNNIWYVSKYVMFPEESYVGHRGHYLSKGLVSLGYKMLIINSNSFNKMRFIDFKNLYNFRELDSIHYITIKTIKYLNSFSIKRFLSWIDFEIKLFLLPFKKKLQKPDVIIISSLSILTILNGIIFKFKYKCKLILEIRDIWPLSLIEYKGYSKNNLFILVLRFIEYIGYRSADKIIGTMPLLYKHVEKVIGITNKVEYIPTGYDLKMLENHIIPDQRINNILNSDKKIVTYIGSIGLANNLNTFFKTIKKLSKNKSIFFLVIGDGELKQKFEKDYGYLENLYFSKPVENKYVHNILSRSHILYFSLSKNKIWEYGQSLNKLINYMLSSRPIIASYYGHKSMINEANCGEYIDVNSTSKLKKTILKFLKLSDKERSIIGIRGKKWIFKHRSYKQLAKYYSEIIKQL